MKLTGQQVQQLHDAILDAYTPDSLRMMVRVKMNETLHNIAGGMTFSDVVFNLIEWAEKQGGIKGLVSCLVAGNKANDQLEKLAQSAQTWFAAVPITETARHNASPIIYTASHVFLAYSRNDSDVMNRLRADLAQEGITCWLDEEKLVPGTAKWQRVIKRAIADAQCMLVILSPDASNSDWVDNEIMYAKQRELPIIPVIARGDVDEVVPLGLTNVHYVDIRTDYASAVSSRLVPGIRKHLRVDVESERDIESLNANKITAHVIEWIRIPDGQFLMGSDGKDAMSSSDEFPQHLVDLPQFWISKTPITNAQYARFVRAANHRAPPHWEDGRVPKGRGDHPVVNVSRSDAELFCAWEGGAYLLKLSGKKRRGEQMVVHGPGATPSQQRFTATSAIPSGVLHLSVNTSKAQVPMG